MRPPRPLENIPVSKGLEAASNTPCGDPIEFSGDSCVCESTLGTPEVSRFFLTLELRFMEVVPSGLTGVLMEPPGRAMTVDLGRRALALGWVLVRCAGCGVICWDSTALPACWFCWDTRWEVLTT